MVLLDVRHRDEYRRKHGEHHGLDVAHQHFEQHHEDAEEDADRCHNAAQHIAHHAAQGKHDEDDARQGDGNHVTSQHIGKESDHQCYRLCEDAKELDEGHQRHGELEPHGYVTPEDFLPVCLRTRDIHD